MRTVAFSAGGTLCTRSVVDLPNRPWLSSAVYGIGNCFEQRQKYSLAIEAFKRSLKCVERRTVDRWRTVSTTGVPLVQRSTANELVLCSTQSTASRLCRHHTTAGKCDCGYDVRV